MISSFALQATSSRPLPCALASCATGLCHTRGNTTTSVSTRNSVRPNGAFHALRGVRSGKPRQHLFTNELDRAHDLVVGHVAGLEHEDHLVDTGGGPFLDLPAHGVGVAADCHRIFYQFIVTPAC